MEIFGLRKMFCFNYTRFTYNESYLFLFSSAPSLDLETVTYSQLMTACDGMFLLRAAPTPDFNNVSPTHSLFLPKQSTLKITAQPANVQQTVGGTLTQLAEHIAYSPMSIDNGDSIDSMTWFEGASAKLATDYTGWQTLTGKATLTPIEYTFDREISVDCFVIRSTTPRATKIEAWQNGSWQTVATFTPVSGLSAMKFDAVVSNKFRISYTAAHSATSLTSAYFGKIKYAEEDVFVPTINFTKAVLCPSTKVGAQLKLFTTSSTLQNDGFDVGGVPCMLMDVSDTDSNSDVFISAQDTTDARLGRFVIGGYLV